MEPSSSASGPQTQSISTEPDTNNIDQREYGDKTNPRFYVDSLISIPPAIADLLETYSGIPRASQIEHILKVRAHAYAARPYPCLGRFRFLDLDVSAFPIYAEHVLRIMTSPADTLTPPHDPVFLDLGTCLGQDLRKLIYDGVDPNRLYGSDIVPEFVDAGYDLFRDEDKFPRDKHFLVPGDVFDDSDANALNRLVDKVDVLNATAVFHLFDWPEQLRVADKILTLLRKDPGQRALVIGAQVGKVEPGASVRNGSRKYRHNEESWRQLWTEVVSSAKWKGRVKSCDVKSILADHNLKNQERRLYVKGTEGESKLTGDYYEGFRAQVFWIWVEFR